MGPTIIHSAAFDRDMTSSGWGCSGSDSDGGNGGDGRSRRGNRVVCTMIPGVASGEPTDALFVAQNEVGLE